MWMCHDFWLLSVRIFNAFIYCILTSATVTHTKFDRNSIFYSQKRQKIYSKNCYNMQHEVLFHQYYTWTITRLLFIASTVYYIHQRQNLLLKNGSKNNSKQMSLWRACLISLSSHLSTKQFRRKKLNCKRP